jgi:8-oxo-dGTP diphosphatase
MNPVLVDQEKNSKIATANLTETMTMTHKLVHVAVGVLINADCQVLIALRPAHVSLAGLWEFPGGKVELNETVIQALKRELHEEIGIEVLETQALMKTEYLDDASKRKILLDVHQVLSYNGTPFGKEGQEIRWVQPQTLEQLSVPPANHLIVKRVMEICQKSAG